MNGAIGYNLVVGSTGVRPQLFVDNIFDKRYLLKGAFFSGAAVGRPRSVQVRVDVGSLTYSPRRYRGRGVAWPCCPLKSAATFVDVAPSDSARHRRR